MGDILLFSNNGSGTLVSTLDAGGTTAVLNSGQGALFPAPAAGQRFMATLIDTAGNIEIVACTGRSADSITIIRAQEGTTAREFAAGSIFEARVTKGVLEQFAQTKGGAVFEDSPTVPDPTALDHAVHKSYADSHGFTTGDVKLTIKTAADSGWVAMNDGTIGNAASGATARANADTEDLFVLLWNSTIDAWCAVSGGRGASAAADFAANKTIALPKALGRALAVAGAGNSLTARALAEYLGEETHTLTITEIPAHTHTGATNRDGSHDHNVLTAVDLTNGYISGNRPLGSSLVWGGYENVNAVTATGSAHSHAFTTNSRGGGGAHNNMQPTSFLNIHIKL